MSRIDIPSSSSQLPSERPAPFIPGVKLPRPVVNVPTTPQQVFAEQKKRCRIMRERYKTMTDKLTKETILLRPLLDERGIGASRLMIHASAGPNLARSRVEHT